jgi:hypothetical protein
MEKMGLPTTGFFPFAEGLTQPGRFLPMSTRQLPQHHLLDGRARAPEAAGDWGKHGCLYQKIQCDGIHLSIFIDLPTVVTIDRYMFERKELRSITTFALLSARRNLPIQPFDRSQRRSFIGRHDPRLLERDHAFRVLP